MGRNNKPLIIGAAIFGLLALVLTMLLLTRGGDPVAPPPPAPGTEQPAPVAEAETSTRLVAARNIPPRSSVTEDMVTTAPVETQTAPGSPAAPATFADYSDVQKLVSQGQLTARPIRAGEPLSADMFIKPIGRVVPANIPVPRGLRAIAIWVDPIQTAAGLVDVGDRIDVIATNNTATVPQNTSRYEEIFTGSKDGNTGRTIGQNLLVLAVDKSILEASLAPTPAPAPAAPGAAPPPPPPPPPPPNQPTAIRVIVAASPAVAELLAAANETAKLKITIRDPNDTLIVTAPGRPVVTSGTRYPAGGIARIPKGPQGSGAGRAQSLSQGNPFLEGGNSRINRPAPPIPNPYDGVPTTGPAGPRGQQGPAGPVGPMIPDGLPAPSGTADVTVIRGTDKQKVTVPAR